MLGLLLNMSFANRIEKGRFIPELKRGDFSHPDLKKSNFFGEIFIISYFKIILYTMRLKIREIIKQIKRREFGNPDRILYPIQDAGYRKRCRAPPCLR